MMIYQGWCMVGVVVMTTGSRQMRPVAPPVRLQTVILTVIATQTVRRSSAQSHVFEHPTGYRLGEADCCVRILWAGDMSDDMEDEAVSAQHRARLVLAARALLGESRGHNRLSFPSLPHWLSLLQLADSLYPCWLLISHVSMRAALCLDQRVTPSGAASVS